MTESEPKLVHWSQLKRGNFGISAEMIANPEGYKLYLKCCVRNPNGSSKDVWDYHQVLFDRKFVIRWIVQRVVEPLMFIHKVDFDKLMFEVWEEYYSRFATSGEENDSET